jgi:outer membrane lipoprotein SlyB
MKKQFLIFAALLALAACAPVAGRDVYDAAEVGKQSDVEFGKILAVRKVKIKKEATGIGAASGAVAGGVGEEEIDDGASPGAVFAGAIAGAVAGAAVERAVSAREGFEYVIKKEDGKIVSIVQNGGDAPLKAGQRVMIQTTGIYQKAADKKKNEQYQRVVAAE